MRHSRPEVLKVHEHIETQRPFIHTLDGPFSFQPRLGHEMDGITLGNLARSLAMTVRYRGMNGRFYTVGEHSVMGCDLIRAGSVEGVVRDNLAPYEDGQERNWTQARDRLALLFLLHDSAEAYTGDIPAPLKGKLYMEGANPGDVMVSVKQVEREYLHRIHKSLGVPEASPAERRAVKTVDQLLFCMEFEAFFGQDALKAVTGTSVGYGADVMTTVDPEVYAEHVRALRDGMEFNWESVQLAYLNRAKLYGLVA